MRGGRAWPPHRVRNRVANVAAPFARSGILRVALREIRCRQPCQPLETRRAVPLSAHVRGLLPNLHRAEGRRHGPTHLVTVHPGEPRYVADRDGHPVESGGHRDSVSGDLADRLPRRSLPRSPRRLVVSGGEVAGFGRMSVEPPGAKLLKRCQSMPPFVR